MPPLYMASSFINHSPRAWRQDVVQAQAPIEESSVTGLEFVRDLECNVACAASVSTISFALGGGVEGRFSDFDLAPLARQGREVPPADVSLALSTRAEDELQLETPSHGHEDLADFMGRRLELGDVVESLRTLYRSQGEDVKIEAGWRGVIVKLDHAFDALVDFGESRKKRWVRRKHFGALKKHEEHELEHSYSSPGSSFNGSFHSVEPFVGQDGLLWLDKTESEVAVLSQGEVDKTSLEKNQEAVT